MKQDLTTCKSVNHVINQVVQVTFPIAHMEKVPKELIVIEKLFDIDLNLSQRQ